MYYTLLTSVLVATFLHWWFFIFASWQKMVTVIIFVNHDYHDHARWEEMTIVIGGHWFISTKGSITLPLQHFARFLVAHPDQTAPIASEMKPILENFQSDKNCWDANIYSCFLVATMMIESNVIRSIFFSITNFDMSNASFTVSCCLPHTPEPIISNPVKPEPFDLVDHSVEEFSFLTTLPTIPISHEILNK